MEKDLTPGEMAKICKVAPTTVSKWIDSGKIKGYKLPLFGYHRATRENFRKFCKANGIPFEEDEKSQNDTEPRKAA